MPVSSRTRAGRALLATLGLAAAACRTPRAHPLQGTPAPAMRVPDGDLPPERQHLVFKWAYSDNDVGMQGEGVARIAPPDSVRLDLFLSGGLGSGAAVMVGNELRLPGGGGMVRRLIPPAPLLWAALGRLAVPAVADTSVRVDGDTVRADIGRGAVWRATFAGERLLRLERLDDRHIEQWVDRSAGNRVRYQDERSGRTLQLTVERRENVVSFDPQIWRF